DQYMEFRYKSMLAMREARNRILNVEKTFEQVFGRSYGGLLDEYRCEDAEVVLVAAGSVAGTARTVVDKLRAKGTRVGLARLRALRPFPQQEVRALGERVEGVAVLDRSYTHGAAGAFFTEVQAALYATQKRPVAKNYIAGLGGRDITPEVIEKIFEDMLIRAKRGGHAEPDWVDVAGVQWGRV
ncbi:TPA: pyruvate ferredoxin oxidoreductase, partial [Thermoplasmata archaeon]|nr:pyruvate ferredoxin oxidoreductase [Thermoplasmata archaeon]